MSSHFITPRDFLLWIAINFQEILIASELQLIFYYLKHNSCSQKLQSVALHDMFGDIAAKTQCYRVA